jgi:hypothetical protein
LSTITAGIIVVGYYMIKQYVDRWFFIAEIVYFGVKGVSREFVREISFVKKKTLPSLIELG